MSNRRERLFSEPKTETTENVNLETGELETEDTFLDEMNEPVEQKAVNEVKGLFVEDYFSNWDELEQKRGDEITGGEFLTAKTMEIGKPYNFLWTGYTTVQDPMSRESRKAARFVNRENESFVCVATLILTALEGIEDGNFPKPVRIISHGMKEGKNNRYWNAKVYKL